MVCAIVLIKRREIQMSGLPNKKHFKNVGVYKVFFQYNI